MAKDIKNVDLNAHLTNGTVIRIRASVSARDYAGVQSKACTTKTNLTNKVLLGKTTPEEAQATWNEKIVEPWHQMVVEPLKDSLPENILNEITSFEPAAEMLNFEVPTQSIQ